MFVKKKNGKNVKIIEQSNRDSIYINFVDPDPIQDKNDDIKEKQYLSIKRTNYMLN